MRVLNINVRLTEGGAAQVALTLHNGLNESGIDSIFAYGYSKGAKRSIYENEVDNCFLLTDRLSVIGNYISHSIIGIDFLGPAGENRSKLLGFIKEADIVHLHVVHSYFIDYKWLLEKIKKYNKKLVWTAHDHWLVTGRCAFVDGCENWKTSCGSCPTNKNYPPSKFDFSGSEVKSKRDIVNSMGNLLTLISPSEHLGNDLKAIYTNSPIKILPNSINANIERHILNYKNKNLYNDVDVVLIVAHDLSYNGKTNFDVVNQIILKCRKVRFLCIGKNSPFSGKNVENLGEIHLREKMVELYKRARALIFTSVVDNFPLTICEALCAGVPVLATESPAAREVLKYVGGVVSDINSIVDIINTENYFSLYEDVFDSESLSGSALNSFGSQAFISSHIKLYKEILS